MATQTTTRIKTVLKPGGKTTDLNQNAYMDKFDQPSDQSEYDKAVDLVESKLDRMDDIKAIFTLNLGTNHPELLIDARESGKAKMVKLTEDQQITVDCQVRIRPVMIQRFCDGLMEARYALNYGHVYVQGPTRVGVKLVDALTPFGARHPKLDRNKLDQLPKPTEDIEQVKRDLKQWGYGLVKNALSGDELKAMQQRLNEQAKGEADAGVAFFDGGEKRPNQRIWNLPNKGQEFLDLLDNNDVIKDFIPEFLGEDAILFSYTANIARPGNTPMHLHTDQITVSILVRFMASID